MSPLPIKKKIEKKLLGQILIDHNLITENQLRIALEEQKRTRKFLGRTLVDLHFIDEKILRKVLSIQSGIEIIKLEDYKISPEIIKKFPAALAKTYQTIPLKLEDKTLTIAISDALNISAQDDLSFILGYKIKIALAESNEITGMIEKYYGADTTNIEDMMKWFGKGTPEISEIAMVATSTGESANVTTLEEIANQAPVVGLFSLVLVQTVKENATDLHLEPFETDFRVRYRVDGVLYDLLHPSPDLAFALFCRFKIMAGMDIAERRLPQDGRIELMIGGREVDLRVNTVPTVFGECLSVRVLDRGRAVLELENVGLSESNLSKVEEIIKTPQGIILDTGPTGSGKTTSLYGILRKLNNPGVKIITTEDPVEYLLDGVIQVPIREKIGLTFSSTLRHILRQDPDIVLVGEIRDLETAEIAIQASLTGHLVFSTLHTNDASSTITRLIDMKVEPFLLASSIIGIIAQRLIRKLCLKCREKYQPTKEQLLELGLNLEQIKEELEKAFYRPGGCPACKGGYKGQTAIFEILFPQEGLWELVFKKRPTGEIREKAIEEGMKTLLDDGLEKIHQGVTSIEEVTKEVHGYA